MRYLKTYEDIKHAKYEIDDIVRYARGWVYDENNVESEKLFIIKKIHEGFGRVFWYDMDYVYPNPNKFFIRKEHLSVYEDDIVKITDKQAERVRIDLERKKYNL